MTSNNVSTSNNTERTTLEGESKEALNQKPLPNLYLAQAWE